MMDDLLRVLGDEEQLDLTVTEIADILWLAQQKWRSPTGALSQIVSGENVGENEASDDTVLDVFGGTDPVRLSGSAPASGALPPAGLKFRQPSSTPLDDTSVEFESQSIAVPDAPALRSSLDLFKALKPLLDPVPSLYRTRLNEAATVQWIAETDVWIPTLEPELEPWLDLILIIDATPSMLVWQQTVREFQRLLQQSGVFRDVRLWSLDVDDEQQVEIRPGYGPNADNLSPCSPKELVDPSGRRLIWIMSDCIDNRWQTGVLSPALKVWVNQGPFALVQVLPESMWSRTRLQSVVKAQFHGEAKASPSQDLKVIQRRDRWRQSSDAMLQVPVFTLEFGPCWRWSCMVAAQGDNKAAGLLFAEQGQPEWQRPSLDSEQRVETFNLFCSPLAGRLARLLSGCPEITLPLIRVIQSAMVSDSDQVHVAEVLYGGILQPTQPIDPYADPDTVVYRFYDLETQRQLARDAIPEETFKTLSRWIEHRLGRSLDEFVAVLENPQSDETLAFRTHAFAGIALETLLRQDRRYIPTAEAYLQRWLQGKLNVSSLDQFVEQWPNLAQQKGLAQQLAPVAEILIVVLRSKGSQYVQVVRELRQLLQEGRLPVPVNAQSSDSLFPPRQELIFDTAQFAVGVAADFPPLQTRSLQVLKIEVDISTPPIQTIDFEYVTLEQRRQLLRQRWVAVRHPAQSRRYVEPLTDDVGLEMVFIPADTFIMGEGNERHQVSVPAFYMGKYSITQAQWKVVAAMDAVNQELDANPSYFKGDDLPVEQVSWNEAVEFCARLSLQTQRDYRLPSEAEWEYACRAGTETPFHFGETISPEVANYRGTETFAGGPKGEYRKTTIPVGGLNAPNAFGLHDMHGNVWEWCEDDYHGSYENAPTDGSAWIDSPRRGYLILRGGSWSYSPDACRSACRIDDLPDLRAFNIGFRVVVSAPGLSSP